MCGVYALMVACASQHLGSLHGGWSPLHAEAVRWGHLSPCLPRRDTFSGICFITICHAKGLSCSIFWANFRNLFSPSDIDSWGSLQAAWNEKSMVTAVEWARFLINRESGAAPALAPPSGLALGHTGQLASSPWVALAFLF